MVRGGPGRQPSVNVARVPDQLDLSSARMIAALVDGGKAKAVALEKVQDLPGLPFLQQVFFEHAPYGATPSLTRCRHIIPPHGSEAGWFMRTTILEFGHPIWLGALRVSMNLSSSGGSFSLT